VLPTPGKIIRQIIRKIWPQEEKIYYYYYYSNFLLGLYIIDTILLQLRIKNINITILTVNLVPALEAPSSPSTRESPEAASPVRPELGSSRGATTVVGTLAPV
jgi:hypothetical protein